MKEALMCPKCQFPWLIEHHQISMVSPDGKLDNLESKSWSAACDCEDQVKIEYRTLSRVLTHIQVLNQVKAKEMAEQTAKSIPGWPR